MKRIMKKIYAFMVAAIALTAVSCNNEAIDEVVGGENIVNGDYITTLTVGLDNTRTQYSEGKTIWTAGDEILLNDSVYKLTDGANSGIGTFSLKEGETPILAGLDTYNVRYPANHDDIPTNQDAVAGSFDPKAAVLGTSTNGLEGLTLCPYHALVKFTVAADAQSVSLLGYTLEGTITAGETYYIAVNPKTYAGLTAVVDETEVKSTAKEIKFDVCDVLNLGVLPVKSAWGVAGSHNNWLANAPTVMLFDGTYHVAYNLPKGISFQFTRDGSWAIQRGFGYAGNAVADSWNLTNGNSNITLPTEADAYDIYFSSENGVFNVVAAGTKVTDYVLPEGKAIYLKIHRDWTDANAYFDAWVWGSAKADAWYDFTKIGEGYDTYRTFVPNDATGMKIVRRNPAEAGNTWDSNTSWGDSGDQTISSNMFVVYGWNDYVWETYAE